MPKLKKVVAEKLNLEILQGQVPLKDLAKKYNVTFKAVWDRKNKLESKTPKPTLYKNEKKNDLVKQTKIDTIMKRLKMLSLLEGPLVYLQSKLKAWAKLKPKDKKDRPPFSREDIKTLVEVSHTFERVLRGIDRAEQIAENLIIQDNRTVNIYQEQSMEEVWKLLSEDSKRTLRQYFSARPQLKG